MKLGKRRIIIAKVFLILFLIFISVTLTISYLYSLSAINKDLYFKLLVNDIYGNNFYVKLVETISNKLNPLNFIEINNNNFNLENRLVINPKIYIYSISNLKYQKEYNVDSNMILLDYYLSEELNNLGISSIYEDNDIKLFSKNNNISTIDALNIFKSDKMENYNLDYIIEIGMKKHSNCKGKYAKIYLYANESNFKFVSKLNSLLNKKVDGISNIYISNENNEILKIDIGGSNNYMSEAIKSVKILSNSFYEVINE